MIQYNLLTRGRIYLVSVHYARPKTACAATEMTTSTPSQIGGENTAAPVAENGRRNRAIASYI